MSLPTPVSSVARIAYTGDAAARGVRSIPEEAPIAFTYNRSA